MDNIVFIADQGTRCGRKISDKFLENSFQVIKATTGMDDEKPDESFHERLVTLDWNLNSSFSPKNIALGLKKFPRITHFAIIYSFPEIDTFMAEQSNLQIQKDIDLFLRSQVLLTREIINTFTPSDSSQLLLVMEENQGNSPNPYREFLKEFINHILISSNLKVNAFEYSGESPENFADFFFSAVHVKGIKSSGKWIKPFQINSILNSINKMPFRNSR